MNTSSLKSFAPEVRRQLMEAVERKLDYVLTADTADLRAMGTQVSSLRRQADRERGALVERVAYTWFNRLAALRFLDARGWHPFKARVLTPANADETQPEVLKLLRTGSLPEELRPHTDLARLNDLLDGRLATAIAGADPQGEVYRHLILAACRFYHATMPFLFEELDDETELLLPDDLLTATSVAEGFRTEISDADCSEVEILGWLYQFYISEKKDAVMARKKAVPSEDIPAVTQLFTPHWIVRYLVENSLGRLWLNSRPNSGLRAHMPYYVEDASSPKDEGKRMKDENGADSVSSPSSFTPQPSSLTVETPEEIRLLDPACGSGHMLTYAFDLLVKIYEEEGHAPSEIPEKILTHNLFGLEICPRAAQLASFALVCKAREQSRRAFRSSVQPQVMVLQNVVFEEGEIEAYCKVRGDETSSFILHNSSFLSQLHQFREHTETFGSLIQPVLDGEKLAALKAKIGEQAPAGDLLVQNTHRKLRLALDQAEMLSQRYQVVVANPPYFGIRGMTPLLKEFVTERFEGGKHDLYSSMLLRCGELSVKSGYVAMITMHSWMFLSSFEKLRAKLWSKHYLSTLAHFGPRAFDTISGEVVQTCAFIFLNSRNIHARAVFIDARAGCNEREKREDLKNPSSRYTASIAELEKVEGAPVAYWLSNTARELFNNSDRIADVAKPRQGLATSDNNRFLRLWPEVGRCRMATQCDSHKAAKESKCRWFPVMKGGSFRKWYGNNDLVVNWENDGKEILAYAGELYGSPTRTIKNIQFYFREGVTWSTISNEFSMRYTPPGSIFETKGAMCFMDSHEGLLQLLAFSNSPLVVEFLKVFLPTLDFHEGPFGRLPFIVQSENGSVMTANECIRLARADWDNFETSWDFRDLPLLRSGDWEIEPGQPGGPWKGRTLAESWDHYANYCNAAIRRMQELETENNRLWIDAYGLQGELTPEVPEDEITLARADPKKDIAAFLSYAVGVMFGRYSLEVPGLVLANAGDTLEDYWRIVRTKVEGGRMKDEGKSAAAADPDFILQHSSFIPDSDAIIPLLDGEWFTDDVVARTREFLRVTFGDDTLEENLRFIEESLGKDLRKYFLTDFYKDHLQTYKKRPIYWLFQSPKKGFGALVYLHRYTKDTVNTLLNDYLRDFLKKLESRIEHLEHVQDTASSTREKTAATKEEAKLKKTLKECREWERDILLPLAQQRLQIDLDDGVKANYPKFGKALAKVAGLS